MQVGVQNCACDVEVPATLEARACSLCKEAEKQAPGVAFFFLKDANPTKPNRMLILPRAHYPKGHSLALMSAADRDGFVDGGHREGEGIVGRRLGPRL